MGDVVVALGLSITGLSTAAEGNRYADTTLKTTMAIAKPHVVFSTTSVVFLTPNMLFDDEKLDASPPPFDSCISTIKVINIDAITINTITMLYISVFVVQFDYLLKESDLVGKVTISFAIIRA